MSSTESLGGVRRSLWSCLDVVDHDISVVETCEYHVRVLRVEIHAMDATGSLPGEFRVVRIIEGEYSEKTRTRRGLVKVEGPKASSEQVTVDRVPGKTRYLERRN